VKGFGRLDVVQRANRQFSRVTDETGLQEASKIQEISEREVRDLPCFEYSTTVVVETYRMKCPRCGFRAEKVAQLPSKAPFSKRLAERRFRLFLAGNPTGND
jgi:Zn finger protein HypA/HybF involved in hydrogenase expression